MAVLSVALGACENMLYGARQGTIEYPGSGAGPNAAAVYVVKDKDTVDNVAQRYGVSQQVIIDRNKLKAPYALRPGQNLLIPGAKYVAPQDEPPTTAAGKALRPINPMLACTKVMGAKSNPATVATTAAKAQTKPLSRLTGMPM